MSDATIPNPEPDHLSLYALERLLTGERRGTAELRAHLDGCAQCQARYAALEADAASAGDHEREAAEVDRIMAAIDAHQDRAPPRRSGLRRLVRRRMWVPAAALAAAVALLVLWPRERGPGGRVRGYEYGAPPVLHVIVREPDGTFRPVRNGESLARTAQIGFRAGCATRCEVIIGGITEADPAMIIEGDMPAPWQIASGQAPAELPASVGLPDQPGDVRFVARFCASPPDREAFAAALEQRYPAGADGQRDLGPEPVPGQTGCVIRSVLISVK